MNKNFKIFDIIFYEGNFDLLNFRLLEYSNLVDYFIIVPTSSEISVSNIKINEKVIISNSISHDSFYDELKKIMTEKYESFDDLLFFSKSNELPDFEDLDSIISELRFRNVVLDHSVLCWNKDYREHLRDTGSYVINFSKLLTNINFIKNLWSMPKSESQYNFEKVPNGWKLKNFHTPLDNETFVRENLLPDVIYSPTNTYMLDKREINFKLPKNIDILAYHKIGRDHMKKHLFLVEASNSVNLNEVSKLYDTVSVIEFAETTNEIIAENIGDSVFKSILQLPQNVLYGNKPLKDFHEDFKKNELKKIIETIFPQDQDNIRIIYRGFDEILGLWENLKNQNFSEIINPS